MTKEESGSPIQPEAPRPEAQESFRPSWIIKRPGEFVGTNSFIERVADQLHKTRDSMLTPDYLQRRFEDIQKKVFDGEVPEGAAETLLSRIAEKKEEMQRTEEERKIQWVKDARDQRREELNDLRASLGQAQEAGLEKIAQTLQENIEGLGDRLGGLQKDTAETLVELRKTLEALLGSPEREPQTDQEIVDSVRQILVRSENRGEILDWMEPRGREISTLLTRIKNRELKERVNDEVEVRRRWLALAKQWDRVNGSEENIGKLLFDMGRINMEPKMLVELSTLPPTKEGVSLSVQISRAMNLYYNFLGVWAEEYSSKPVPKDEEEEKDPKKKEEKTKNRLMAAADPVQLRLSKISNEGKIPNLEKDGIRADFLKKMIVGLPEELRSYKASFLEELNKAPSDKPFKLSEIFGGCMFIEEVSDLDVAWTKFVVSKLSGSEDAAILALEMLDFTGESDELNINWVGGAYAATDYQKLLRMEKRREDEKKKGYPFGPEATLGRYPKDSGKGWFRRAKVTIDKKQKTVKQWFNGEWNQQINAWDKEPMPFHKMNWKSLPEKTYTLDFVYPNMRSWVVFSKCTSEDFGKDNGMEALEAESLRSINKAFNVAFGDKDKGEWKTKAGNEKDKYGVPKWVRYSPWVWYVIGDISLHNPYIKVGALPGMSSPPLMTDRWLLKWSTEAITSGKYYKSFEQDVLPEIRRAGFLTNEEMDFVLRYCSGKIT